MPAPWLTAWIAPIYKKWPRNEPENYPPVSQTCVMFKLLEHIMCTHIRTHMDKHGILTSFNYGFHSKHSRESQLLLITHDLLVRADHRDQVGIAVLDFNKAFDTLPHLRLLQKLELLGIHWELLPDHGDSGCGDQGLPLATRLDLLRRTLGHCPGATFISMLYQWLAQCFGPSSSSSDICQWLFDLQIHAGWGWSCTASLGPKCPGNLGYEIQCEKHLISCISITLQDHVSMNWIMKYLVRSNMPSTWDLFSLMTSVGLPIFHLSWPKLTSILGFIRRNLWGSPHKYRETAYQ